MNSYKLNLTPVRKKFSLADKYHTKIERLKREAAKDIKNIIKKSNLVRDLGDYFERVEASFDIEKCGSCAPCYTTVEIRVTKDTPKEVRERIDEILYTELSGKVLPTSTTNRTSQEKVKKKGVKSYE